MAISTHDLNLAASICRELILMRDGRVLASRSHRRGLDAGERAGSSTTSRPTCTINSDTGHMTVVPVAGGSPCRLRMTIRRRIFTVVARVRAVGDRGAAVGADGRQHADFAGASLRSLDSVGRERRRADLFRRAAAARAGRRTGRRHPRGGRRGPAGAAAQSAGDAVHAGRLRRRVAWRDARGHDAAGTERAGDHVDPARELCRLARRHRHRLRAGARRNAAACRRTCCCWPASR